MLINNWAKKWGISIEAINDLKNQISILDTVPPVTSGKSEATVQSEVRLKSRKNGVYMWRNNRGACEVDGRFIRFGLGNDSSKIDKVMKSSDLIGITPVQTNIGKLGVFTAYEIKKEGWVFRGTETETGQLNFINLVNSLGGIGRFICDSERI